MLANGRIAGIAGIVGGLADARGGDLGWRLAFVAGLVAGPFVVTLLGWPVPRITIEADLPVVIIGGLIVGVGVRLGSGCTSGHGVCGLARGSPRSLVATLTFMAVAAAVVFIARHGVN